LLPAAAKLEETHPEARLRLVISLRPAAMLGRINHIIDELGIRDVTDVCHELSEEDLREVLLTSSCVVIPSYSEGFYFAAAVAMGIPVISFGWGRWRKRLAANI
jgi:glycosyltransferase involved in cell wall biosynthesis